MRFHFCCPSILILILIFRFSSAFTLQPRENLDNGKEKVTDRHTSGILSTSRNVQNNISDADMRDGHDRVIYSYAEANVNIDGTPSIRQLTIVKGKDGEVRYSKNQNGTIEVGRWNGPVPIVPTIIDTTKMVEDKFSTAKIETLLKGDPLAKLNENIGNSLENYILKSLALFKKIK